MKRFSKFLAILLAVTMVLPGMVGIVEAAPEEAKVVERLAGDTRIGTAVEASKKAYEDGAGTVVLAGYNGTVDALTGTLLAKAKDAPLLLTAKGELSKETKEELERLEADEIYIVGGENVVSKDIKNTLSKKYTVNRVAGKRREETAQKIAEEAGFQTEHVFLALGHSLRKNDALADALAIGPASAKEGIPVLLTGSTSLSRSTKTALEELEVEKVTIIGGEKAISKDVLAELKELDIEVVKRIAGDRREETSIKIAEEYFNGSTKSVVAYGWNDADALVGGYLGAKIDGPILLANTDKLHDGVEKFLENNTGFAYVLGGEAVISKDTFDNVKVAVKEGSEDPEEPEESEAKEQLETNLKYIHEKIENPSFGTGAGEWSILSLARGGYDAPEEYYDLYHANVEKAVEESMKDGKLHRAKSTEHSRLILGFSAIGRDITNVAGYDIRKALGDFDYSTRQGINGPIFALIALDSKDYEIPEVEGVKNQSTREKFIDYILEKEITQEDGEIGGWALHGNVPDPDITGMAIQGLTPYYESNEDVKVAIDRGIEWLSKAQKDDGGYSSWGSENIESASQVVVALTGLGIDPHKDSRFVKNGNSIIDNLLTFAVKDGGFMHVKPGGNTGGGGAAGQVDGMATDQGTYALVAYDRFVNGQNRLYDMTDVKVKPNPESAQTVYVTVENIMFTEAEGAPWSGKLLDMYPVEIETEAMMDAVEKALAENSYQAEGIKSNYITSIHGLSALQEGSGEQSGWMSTINGWFANVGAEDITVEDGDVIDFMFSKNYGGDIGSKWGDNSTFLKGIEFDSGELTEEFDKNQTEYTLTLPEGTSDLVVKPTAENKNFQVRTYLDQYTPDSKGYKLTRGIPVENGSKVIIGVGDPAWASMNEGAEGTIYTINIKIKTKK